MSEAEREGARLEALRSYAILDTSPEEAFDDLTRLASEICQTPVALVTLVDATRQWFKSRVGVDTRETPREVAFCHHAIQQEELFEVKDAALDPRFAQNPLVTADPNIRFYAGMPLRTAEGHGLGTLCVIDRTPRQLTEGQREALRILGRQVQVHLELRRHIAELNHTAAALRASEVRYRDLVEKLPLGLYRTTPDGRILEVNPALLRMLGYETLEQFAGRNLEATTESSYPRAAFRERIERDGRVVGLEAAWQRADGQTVVLREHARLSVLEDGQRVYDGTLEDVTDRRRAEANRQQLLAVVAHELRTPLTSIYGAVSFALTDPALPGQARQLLEIAARNTERMTRLVTDLLDAERGETGMLPVEKVTCDVVPLVAQSIEANGPYARLNGVELEVNAPAPHLVRADPDRLLQVMANLISNAVKFSPAGSRVTASVEARGGVVRVSVADQGPGIPEEFRSQVFERFAQAASDARRKGSGLGLNISRAIVEAHGGRIGFDTETGRGTTFWFEIPREG